MLGPHTGGRHSRLSNPCAERNGYTYIASLEEGRKDTNVPGSMAGLKVVLSTQARNQLPLVTNNFLDAGFQVPTRYIQGG